MTVTDEAPLVQRGRGLAPTGYAQAYLTRVGGLERRVDDDTAPARSGRVGEVDELVEVDLDIAGATGDDELRGTDVGVHGLHPTQGL